MPRSLRPGRLLAFGLAVAVALGALAVPASVLAQDPATEPSSLACTAEIEPNDQPEQAPSRAGELCLAGTLADVPDQDLSFWEVAPEDGLTTWSFTMRGVPTTITSAHVFSLPTPVTYPLVDLVEVFRADSDAHLGMPPITTETRLAPGSFLVGISR